MITTQDRRLTCQAVAWTHDGPQLQIDEQHAFRYEVRNASGVVGFIAADRARWHPDVRWRREVFKNGKIEDSQGTYVTVEEALGAF